MSLKPKVSSLKSPNRRSAPKHTSRTARRTLDVRPETLDRPFVFVNMAMTADGKIATANRAIASFGSQHDHEHLLELRATADAVMSGARTVDSAKINMGPGGEKFQCRRLKRGLAEFNLRIIVSGSGSIDPCAEIFKKRRPISLAPSDGERAGVRVTTLSAAQKLASAPIIILTTEQMSASSRRRLQTLGVEIKICGKNKINFRAALRWLKQHRGVNRLLCEGGGDLNDALFRTGLVDELHLTVCPKIFGGRHAPTIAEGVGFEKLAAAHQFQLKSSSRVGDEMFLVYGKQL